MRSQAEYNCVESNKDLKKGIWEYLTGDRAEFSMENRAFNFASVLTLFLLVSYTAYDLYLGMQFLATILISLVPILAFCYYFSRFKKRYELSLFVYAFFSYAALIVTYFVNAGINGPILIVALITLAFLTTISRRRYLWLWVSIHMAIGATLLFIEFHHPNLVPQTYPDRHARFIDVGFTYISGVAFIFAIIRYVRGYFDKERKAVEDAAEALKHRNEKIEQQNNMLEQVSREKDKLFSIVSHDLKAPLDSIHGYMDILSSGHLSATERAEIEVELHEQTKYTSDLLMNLMSWAKAQMQGITVNLTSVDLKQAIVTTTGNKVGSAARKAIKITNSVREHMDVIADKDMLNIVLRNLLNNAIKFTKPGGEILIKALREGNEAVISVQDNGIGIPEAQQQEIFSSHARSTFGTSNEKGIGLGLRMCKEFIDYQHGRIWFEST